MDSWHFSALSSSISRRRKSTLSRRLHTLRVCHTQTYTGRVSPSAADVHAASSGDNRTRQSDFAFLIAQCWHRWRGKRHSDRLQGFKVMLSIPYVCECMRTNNETEYVQLFGHDLNFVSRLGRVVWDAHSPPSLQCTSIGLLCNFESTVIRTRRLNSKIELANGIECDVNWV